MTSQSIYKGNLRTENEHLQSGTKILTDAPTDNHGQGEAFSPTDLVATALANCMLTIMGIYANRKNLDLTGMRAETEKVMYDAPRRIGELKIELSLPADLEPEQRKKLEHAAETCPVHYSLHPEIKKEIHFTYK